ncbi:MAG: ribonuclease HI [Crocinitomicaceae bacterium]|nr:MAG: ribonuclease HI [Crocinitomicaceae bacterium]
MAANTYIEIYTDGAAKGNPGPGGFGTILRFKNVEKEFSQGFRLTTNNRMELLAVITGLEALKSTAHPIRVFSDSKYVVDSIAKGWVFNWQKKGFKDKKNPDLWRRFLQLYPNFKIEMIWIKGHNGHPENERCDRLAVQASESKNLAIDVFYEDNEQQAGGNLL